MFPALFLAAAAAIVGGSIAARMARPVQDPAAAYTVPLPTPSRPTSNPVPMPRTEVTVEVAARDPKPAVEAPAPHVAPRPSMPVDSPRAAQKRVAASTPPPGAPQLARFASAVETRPSVAAAVPETVPPVQEAPPPDRWQVMADAIARCSSDGFFAGIICEQRVRLKYCEGYWGQAAQCASRISNDQGR